MGSKTCCTCSILSYPLDHFKYSSCAALPATILQVVAGDYQVDEDASHPSDFYSSKFCCVVRFAHGILSCTFKFTLELDKVCTLG